MSKSKTRRKVKQKVNTRWVSSLVAWYNGKRSILQFCFIFGVLLFSLYGLLAIPYFEQWLYAYLKVNAWLSNNILNSFGQDTSVSDVTISSSQFTMNIRRGCDAVEPAWLLCSTIVATQATIIQKAVGIVVGTLCLQVCNLVRIVSLYLLGTNWPSAFNSFHLEIWPTAFILGAIVLYAKWKHWTTAPQMNEDVD